MTASVQENKSKHKGLKNKRFMLTRQNCVHIFGYNYVAVSKVANGYETQKGERENVAECPC